MQYIRVSGFFDLIGHVLAARGRQTVQELAAERAELHELAVDLKIRKDAHALVLGHLVFIQAVPDVGVDKVRAAHGVALVRDRPCAAGELAVGLQNLLVPGAQLMPLRTVVHKVHTELRRDEAERCAHLRTVADKDDLAVFEPLARRQVLADRAQVADLLRGVVIVAHAVDDRDRARLGKLHDRAVLDDARHDHIDQPREHPARVADGLVAAELDHAGAEILRVTAELTHGRLERHARAGARLLEDHAEVLVFHQRGIIPLRDGALDGQRQLDDVQQLLPGEVVGVDKVLFVHIHSSKGASSGFASRLLSAKPRADMRCGAKIFAPQSAQRASHRRMRRRKDAQFCAAAQKKPGRSPGRALGHMGLTAQNLISLPFLRHCLNSATAVNSASDEELMAVSSES